MKGEPFAWLDVNEAGAGWQHAQGRREHEVGDALDKNVGHEHADADGHTRADEAIPELIEMLQESHLACAIVVRFLDWELISGFGHNERL